MNLPRQIIGAIRMESALFLTLIAGALLSPLAVCVAIEVFQHGNH